MPRLHRRHRKWLGRLMNAFCVRHSQSEERLFLDPEHQLLIELHELRCLNKRCPTPFDDWEQALWLAGAAAVAPKGASIPVLSVCLGFENSELGQFNKRIVYSSYSELHRDKMFGDQGFIKLACEEFTDEPVIDGLPASVWLQCVEPTLAILKSLSILKHRKSNLTNKKDITNRPLDSGYSQHGDFQFGPLAVFAFPRRVVMRLDGRVGSLRNEPGSFGQMQLNGVPPPRNNHRRHRNIQLYHIMHNGDTEESQLMVTLGLRAPQAAADADDAIPLVHLPGANNNEGNLNDNANYPNDLGPIAYAPDYLPDIEVVAQHLFLADPPQDLPDFPPNFEVDEHELLSHSDESESSDDDSSSESERDSQSGRLSDIEVVDLEEFPEDVQPRPVSASPSRDDQRAYEAVRAVVEDVVADIVGRVDDGVQLQDGQVDVEAVEDPVRAEAAGGEEGVRARAYPDGIFEPRENDEHLSYDLGRIILSDSDMSLENALCVDQPPYKWNHTFHHLERGTPLQPQLPKVRRLRQKLKVFLTSECGDVTGSVLGAEIMRRVTKDHYTRRRIMVILNKLSGQEDGLAVNVSEIGDSVCVSVVDQLPPTITAKDTCQRTRRERIMERMRRAWDNFRRRFRRLRDRFTGRYSY